MSGENKLLHRIENYETFLRIFKEYNFCGAEWYGGAYIDERGDICVKYVEGLCEKPFRDEIASCANGQIHFEKARYSYRKLSGLCAEIIGDPDNISRGIIGAGIDEKSNKIILAVTRDFHNEGTLSGRDEFSFERFEWLKTDISIQPADKLSNGKCFFSAGYPAKSDKKVCGVVTAGHLSEIKKGMPIFCGDKEIGSVSDFECSDVMDAAFIELNGSNKCSDIVSVAPNPRINGLAPEFICGAAVEMYSSRNGRAQMGRVVYPSFNFMNLKNITVFTYSAAAGDSGAPVLISFPSGKHVLAAIHLGTFSLSGRVYSYGRSAKDINKRFSLELDANN